MKQLPWIIVLALTAVIFFFAGRWFSSDPESHSRGAVAKAEVWTCSMHPQIKLPKQGACPICGMDLIPLAKEGSDAGERILVMSEADRKLAEVETSLVERRVVAKEIRLVGKVEYDETRVRAISAWIPGRIERLYVDYTGVKVSKGDHLVQIYSAELLTAQQELIEARKRVDQNPEQSEFLKRSNQKALESAREKLRLWGLADSQIEEVENRGTAVDRMDINSPIAGIVVNKNVHEGMYVKVGTQIFTVADLSHTWVLLDAYESDLAWLRYGQEVRIEAEAFPGEPLVGWISFLDPTLDPKTRTVKVRVNVPNPDGKLKPKMFVRAVVSSKVASGGRVMEPRLEGKYICPMHPEVVKEGPKDCNVCGMDLVTPDKLNFVASGEEEPPLIIPASAVLRTGKRAVVYVEVAGADRPTYEGREILLGPRAGEFYLVRDGLEEGERVVTRGNFKIDSAMQIQAKPSMMSMEPEEKDLPRKKHSGVGKQLGHLYQAYFQIQEALASDDLEGAKKGFGHLEASLSLLPRIEDQDWGRMTVSLAHASRKGKSAGEIAAARAAFQDASAILLQVQESFGHGGSATHYKAFCPMAADGEGAAWLQQAEEIRNPYFGSSMLRCGEVQKSYAPEGK